MSHFSNRDILLYIYRTKIQKVNSLATDIAHPFHFAFEEDDQDERSRHSKNYHSINLSI